MFSRVSDLLVACLLAAGYSSPNSQSPRACTWVSSKAAAPIFAPIITTSTSRPPRSLCTHQTCRPSVPPAPLSRPNLAYDKAFVLHHGNACSESISTRHLGLIADSGLRGVSHSGDNSNSNSRFQVPIMGQAHKPSNKKQIEVPNCLVVLLW